MNKILLTFSILISFSFGQSGGKSLEKYLKNLTVMVGMNQSFYGTDWKDRVEHLKNVGTDVDQKHFES